MPLHMRQSKWQLPRPQLPREGYAEACLGPLPQANLRTKRLDKLFDQAERSAALLSRCQPRNAAAEASRLAAAWTQGRMECPRWTYAPVPDLLPLREQLAQACETLDAEHPIEELYLRRAEELQLETLIVEAIATLRMPELSSRRFQAQDDHWRTQASSLAKRWVALAEPEPEPWIFSDDLTDPRSLFRQLQSLVGALRLPFRVELTERLSADAATGSGIIFVASGRRVSPKAGQRIAHHEVYGHALPRYRAARQRLGLFSVASAAGNDEQEGFALYQEDRVQLLDNARKRELGARHIAATLVFAGADYPDVVTALRALSFPLEQALKIAGRVLRGGGLAREYSYLPSYCRVKAAAHHEPALLEWLGQGRLSVHAARVLRTLARPHPVKPLLAGT